MTYRSELPAPAPKVNPETKPFWDATAEGRLTLKRCNSCGQPIWYPRSLCPECGSFDTEWFDASGQGTVYSFTVNHHGYGPYSGMKFVIAYVELDEGPRMLTNIVGVDPAEVSIGQRVTVVFDDTGEGSALPRFRPVPA